MNKLTNSRFRIQDTVARTAKVNLKDTVRVLRAFAMVFHVVGEKEIEKKIDCWLLQSAQYDGFPSPLHSKPDTLAIKACDELFNLVLNEFGNDGLHNLYHLNTDPYYDIRVKNR